MEVTVKTISLADTVFMLRAKLGPIRNWAAFLNEINATGASNVRGHQLKPCLRQHDGRAYRPRYAVTDVNAFIRAVQAIEPEAKPAQVKTATYTIEPGKPWRLNKFDKQGNPVASAATWEPAIA